jgi:hypothetical protein
MEFLREANLTLFQSPSRPVQPTLVNVHTEDLVCKRMSCNKHITDYFQTSRVDLMTFDSPFITDPLEVPAQSETDLNFESTWNALGKCNSRGWSELPIDDVVHRLQGQGLKLKVITVDRPPFEGLQSYPMSIPPTHPTFEGR